METNMTRLGELDLIDAAREAAGNWQNFKCFVWYRNSELKKPEFWSVIYTHNPTSGLLDQSNAAVINKAMLPFSEGDDHDVVFESHNHWAVGHVDGFSIRVFRRGRITKAFRTYHELAERMAIYPILDENDYSEREYEATYENVGEAAWKLKQEFELPEDWQSEVFSWLSNHRDNALESRDDNGGWPSEEDLESAFESLRYQRAA
jgi:hypothetical protein